jgi:dodecin
MCVNAQRDPKGSAMADNIYSVSEIVGSSTNGLDDAIRSAISRASKTLHNLDWFEVNGIRGRIEDGGRCHFQVTLKVGFRLDEPPA